MPMTPKEYVDCVMSAHFNALIPWWAGKFVVFDLVDEHWDERELEWGRIAQAVADAAILKMTEQ